MAIHICGGMEHNLTRYAKIYVCGSIKVLGSNEFTREIDHNKILKNWILVSRC